MIKPIIFIFGIIWSSVSNIDAGIPDSVRMTSISVSSCGNTFMTLLPAAHNGCFALGIACPAYGSGSRFLAALIDSSGDSVWAKQLGSGVGYSGIFYYGGAFMNDGGLLLAGQCYFDSIQRSDIYLMKITATGDSVWVKRYGDTHCEQIYGITPLPNGGFMLFGDSYVYASSTKNGLLCRLDAQGNLLWMKLYGSLQTQEIRRAAVSAEGNINFVGDAYSNTTGKTSIWVGSVDTSGSLLWSKNYLSTQVGEQVDFQQLGDGGSLVVGTVNTLFSSHSSILLLRLNSTGDTLWTRPFADTNALSVKKVFRKLDGSIVVLGNSISGLPSIYLASFDSVGSLKWARSLNGGGYNTGLELGDHTLCLAGWTSGGFYGAGGVLRLKDNPPPHFTTKATDLPTAVLTQSLFHFQLQAADSFSGDKLVYALSAHPTAMTFDTLLAVINWTPQRTDTGTYNLTAWVRDRVGQRDSVKFIITVGPDSALIWDNNKTRTATLNEGDSMVFQVTTNPALSSSMQCRFLRNTSVLGTGSRWVLKTDQRSAGTWKLRFLATLGTRQDSVVWNVTVYNVAVPPTLLSPVNNARTDLSSALVWLPNADPDLTRDTLYSLHATYGTYTVYVDTLRNCYFPIESLYIPPAKITSQQVLKWQVRAFNDSCTTGYSAYWNCYLGINTGSGQFKAQTVPLNFSIKNIPQGYVLAIPQAMTGQPLEMSLVNLLGRCYASQIFYFRNGGYYTVNLSDLNAGSNFKAGSGVYLIRLRMGNMTRYSRIVIP